MFQHALIMAAGRGTRMLPLTTEKPKALLDVDGYPLISCSLNQIREKVLTIHVTVGYDGYSIAAYALGAGVHRIIDTSGKGNAWWIFNSPLSRINQPVLVMPCDLITRIDIDFIYQTYQEAGAPCCMLVPVEPVEGVEGDYIGNKCGVVTWLSRTRKSNVYCSGIQVINPYRINQITDTPFDDFYDVWEMLIQREMLICSAPYPHIWYSVNTPEQLHQAHRYNTIIH